MSLEWAKCTHRAIGPRLSPAELMIYYVALAIALSDHSGTVPSLAIARFDTIRHVDSSIQVTDDECGGKNQSLTSGSPYAR